MALLDGLNAGGLREFITLMVRSLIVFMALLLRVFCKMTREDKVGLGWDDFWIVSAVLINYTSEAAVFWGRLVFKGVLDILTVILQVF